MMNDKETTMAEVSQLVADFVDQRDWNQFHSPKNLSMALSMEAGELMEHFQWISMEESREVFVIRNVLTRSRKKLPTCSLILSQLPGNSISIWLQLMNREGIKAVNAKTFRVTTTDSKHDFPIAPNQQFSAEKPNQIWLNDFTYIHTKEGFTYLCSILDLFSRRIVGWETSRKIDTQLALDALNQAITFRTPDDGLIVHSDRGSQFASHAYSQRITECDYLQSMSRKGNCYDNAPMESFFKTYKTEEVYHCNYQTHEHATRGSVDFIDCFYNRTRRHSAIEFLSPIDFESQYHKQLLIKSETTLN